MRRRRRVPLCHATLYTLAFSAGLRPALNLVLAGGWLAALTMMLAALAFDIFSSINRNKLLGGTNRDETMGD
jgi:hypothetical protein